MCETVDFMQRFNALKYLSSKQSYQLNMHYNSPPCDKQLFFSMVIENQRIRGEHIDSLPSAIKFPIDLIDFIVDPKMDTVGNPVVLLYGQAQVQNAEWKYTAQVRIKTGTEDRYKGVRVVDRAIFEFGNRMEPLTFLVTDPEVKRIKFEMKFIKQIFEKLPSFEKGDVILLFRRGEKLHVDKSLLALHSRYMASVLHDAAPSAIVDLCDFECGDFIELLYQIYSTHRPISADLEKLARASNAYKADRIIEKIIAFISKLDMDLIAKLQLAINLQLTEAVDALAYNAEQRGKWTEIIEKGFNPKKFGNEIYHRIICPAIIRARLQRQIKKSQMIYPRSNFFKPQPPFTVPLIVNGETLHVNKGIMAIHGVKGFNSGKNGQLIIKLTPEIETQCAQNGISLLDLVITMLLYIYPGTMIIPTSYIRPLMLLADRNKMRRLLGNMGDLLAMEPSITCCTMLEHFMYASRFQLGNLYRANLVRIEGSFKDRAAQLVVMPQFQDLPEKMRKEITDRHCSGWALHDQRLANLPTNHLVRTISLIGGGAIPNLWDANNVNALADQAMTSDDAFGSVHELIMSKDQK